MKKGLNDLLGCTIEHKIFGSCKIVEIDDVECGKFTGEILKDKTLKKLIFSTQYFNGIDMYKTVSVTVRKPKDTKRVHKEVDYNKYRNHPLVKEIDRKEMGYRKQLITDSQHILDEAED